MMQLVRLSSRIALILVGIFFVVSAYGKAVAMIDFEMYVYRLNFLPWSVCTVMCRLLVCAECVVGLALCWPVSLEIFGRRVRIAEVCALCMLFFFSLFLLFLIGEGVGGNCHCMGEMIDLEPGESIVKNVTLTALVVYGLKYCEAQNVRVWIASVVYAVLFVGTLVWLLVRSPLDFMVLTREMRASQEMLTEYLHNKEVEGFAKDGRRIVCAFSPKCGTCRLCATKLTPMCKRMGVADSLVLVLMRYKPDVPFEEQKPDIDEFKEVTKIGFSCFKLVETDTIALLAPQVPTVMFIDGDSIVRTRSYRSLCEEDVKWVMGK